MVVINVAATNCTPQTIVIGRRGTYDTMQIAFDLSNLIDAYGNGVAVLAVKRSQDESAYPAVTTQADNTLTWTVSETDTAYVGAGECQLMWYVDGGLAKTIIYPMAVMRDILATSEEAPDAYQTWVDDLTALGAETLQNAQNAEQSASDAETAKDDAVTAKEGAEAAQQAAETAVTHYPKIENNYWMVWDSTSQSYVSTGIQAEGEDGYSPEITITSITGGHRVIITDKDHPQGQSFDVMDGQGGGTSNYADLSNKPKINNVELNGNKTAHDLGLAAQSDIPTVPVQSVNGKTGAVNLASGDIAYDESATYQAGSVGAELQEQNRQLSDLEDAVTDPTTGLDTKAPVILETVSGAIASFDDGADGQPIRKLVANIEPVQDLHGQDAPYPAGGGKNKLKTDGLVQGTPSDTSFGNATKRTFTLGTFVTNLTPNNYYQPNRVTQVSVAENSISVTTDAAAYALALPMTGLTVGAVYVVSAVKTSGTIAASFYKEDGTFISNTVDNASNFTVPAETYYTLIHFNPTADGTQATFTNIQLELGSSPTSYSPYSNICPISGHTGADIYHEAEYDADANPTISVNWETEAGTVYGGEDEVISGKLKSTMGMVDLGDLTWASDSNRPGVFYSNSIIGAVSINSAVACSVYKIHNNTGPSDINNGEIGSANAYIGGGVFVKDSNFVGKSGTEVKALLAGVQLCYELAEPVEYTLTGNEMETLYGQNNIWASTGDTTVEYSADTKLYIEQLTKPTEDDMTADHAISAGTFFQLGNTLYLATAQIAAGATITPGTNATKLSLADALNTLNS